MTEPILSIRDLSIAFPRRAAPSVTVVDGVGSTSCPARSWRRGRVGLRQVDDGAFGAAVAAQDGRGSGQHPFSRRRGPEMSPDRIREMRGALVSMVFQDPMTSFNPVSHRRSDRRGDRNPRPRRPHQPRERVASLLALVGIPDRRRGRGPIRMSSPAACASVR